MKNLLMTECSDF